MGATHSLIDKSNYCNYDCPVCQKTGKTPNLAGKFHIITATQCQCNACNSVFETKDFYKSTLG